MQRMKMGALKGPFCILFLFCFIVSEGSSIPSCEPNPCSGRAKCLTAVNGSHYCECPANRIGDLCQYENPCSPNQCQNSGSCSYSIVDGRGPEFKCTCPIGYTASLCEISLPNACDTDPCKNRATCSLVTINSFKCICPAGFKGETCEQVDHCASAPCLNQGECTSTEDGFQCRCLPGFSGPTCTVDVDECAAADPCVRGKCLNLHGSYRCQCPEGYTGQKCESVYVPCEPSPCQNNARCVKYGEFKYHCECAPGYTGRHCEVNIDDCSDSHQCKNGGQCVDGVLGYTCKCPKNYKGPFCQEDVDECMEASVCRNGGTCVNTVGGYHCICVNGWEGEHCQINHNDCVGTVCYNGGTCHDRVASFFCECPIGKTGLLCHLDDACMSNPCQSGAICTTNPVDGAYLCSCPKGYYGVDCANDINECDMNGNPCEHGGTCVNTPGSYGCHCPKGWTGGWCEVNINECASNPCHNDATCLDDVGRFICVCMPGFTGLYCETDTRTPAVGCNPNPCQHGGSCQRKANGFECSCTAGFDGPTCQTAVDACEANPCENGATCSKKGATFSCRCPPSFTGDRCQVKLDPCRGNHCENGAVCTPSADFKDFSCQCPVGFTGPFCAGELNECASNPCQHGGVCFDKKNGFECSCQTGYSGLVCEQNVNDCADKPCLNDGTCIDGINRYSCHCPAQFTGDRCQHILDPCRGHHCDNGAVCTPSPSFRDYKCQCPVGFTGAFCDDDIDECANSPCLNGAKCINGHGSYRCKCADGFTGQDCEINHDECASNPCLNQGRCVDTVNGFQCECQPGFSGRQCASNVDECSSNPCDNGATCVDGVDGYVCLCRHGFSGTHCHINDPDCQPGLCLHGGTCHDGVNNYRCECSRGYSGKNCQTKVDLDAYNATDHYEGELCKQKDCLKKANNGICDAECNFFACNYDGEDCSAGLRPFENCTATPSYCAHVFRDGKCDDVCNNEACLFDGFDCQGDVEPCNPLYVQYCVKHFGNAKCDAGCNTSGCGFDGGDCEANKEQRLDLTGDVIVILLVDADTFVNSANRFMMTISKALHSTVRIKAGSDGQPLIYEWNSGEGLGPLVTVKDNKLKGLTTADSRKKRSSVMERLTGVLVVLSVDVTNCKEQLREDCFSDVLSVAAYLGAANAKQDLQELGMPLYSAYGQKPVESGETAGNPLMVAVISLLCMLALVLLALMVLANRKRKITAPVWVPPIGGESSKVSSMATGVNMVGKGGDLCYHSAGGNTYEANEFEYKRTRRLGPEGQEIPAAALGHYLAFGQQSTDGNYEDGNSYYEKPTLPIKLSGQDDPRKWSREHYLAAGAVAPLHAPTGDVNARGPFSQTPIMIAAKLGRDIELDQARVVKQLLDDGAQPNEHSDGDGNTALMLAVSLSRDESVRVMLQRGGDPTEYNNRGDTALHHAITINNANILRMLLETGRCDVDHANYDGQTPLILAAKVSHASTECAQLLLKYKADCFGNGGKSAADNDGKTALHWAAVNNNVELIDLLITHGANKDAQDNKDQTPLFLAAREGHMEAVERLVQAGASKEISDQMERWPREIADENGRQAVVNYLDKVPSPHLPPHGVAVGPMNAGGTLPHSMRSAQKPKTPRRSKSVREPKDKKPPLPKKPVMSPQEVAYAQQQHLMQQQRLIAGAVRSPPSVPNMESPYSTTPSPGTFVSRHGECASLQAAAASSCMLSPYSEPHSGSSTSGLSPPQATLPTSKGYKSPPPYGTATSGGWQTSPESYINHSPPEQTYYQQQRDVYQPTVIDNGYGTYNADCYQQTQLPYCQQEQLQQQAIHPGQTVDAYSGNNGFYGYNVAHGMY